MSELMESVRFPDEARNALNSVAPVDNAYGRDECYLDSQAANQARCIKPFDDEFQINIEEGALIPLRIEQRQKNTTRKLRNLFRKETTYSYAPGSADGVLFLSNQESAKYRRQVAQKLYPNCDTLEDIGEIALISLPEENPIYATHSKEDATAKPPLALHHQERLSRNSLLTNELHQVISQNGGRVVYEGAPEGTDRLVIALQDVHGDMLTPWELYAHYGQSEAVQFLRYQQAMTNTMAAIADKRGNHNTQYILETMSNEPAAIANHLRVAKHAVRSVTNPAFQRLATGKHSWARDSLYANARFRIAAEYNKRVCSIYGDNRREREQDTFATKKALKTDRQYLQKKEGFGVGSASAFNEVQAHHQKQIMHQSHREVIQSIATNLKAGDTGVMLYGAGHFSSGTRTDLSYKESFDGHELERYFRFLPNTQLVVVEWRAAEPIFNNIMAMADTFNAMPNTERLQYKILISELERSVLTLETLAVDRQAHLQNTGMFDTLIRKEVLQRDATVEQLQCLIGKQKAVGEESYADEIQRQIREIMESTTEYSTPPDTDYELEIPDDFWSQYD